MLGDSMAEQGTLKRIEVDKLDLDLENPRHGKLSTPEAAITHLVEKERVVELAVDIAKKGGTNPMDLLGVIRRKGSTQSGVYVSAEGNRRVCALMLLHDPEKIPKGVHDRAKKIRVLENVVATNPLPKAVNCIVFSSKKEAMPWITLMHVADQDGRARRRWTAQQQSNALGGGRNSDAMQVLELAEVLGQIEKTDHDQKLTTVQRYLSNPTMRIALGVERLKDKTLVVKLQGGEFSKIFEAFMLDVRNGKLSSRSDAKMITEYAAGLMNSVSCDRTEVAPYPLTTYRPVAQEPAKLDEEADQASTQPSKPGPMPLSKPPERKTIGRNADFEEQLFSLQSQKLTSLYLSCVSLPLSAHSPLITVGLWSILETLSAKHAGREVQFIKYIPGLNFAKEFGIEDRNQRKTIVETLERVSNGGNSTKHHPVAATFDGGQLANDFDVLVPLLIAICAKIPK
jgi:hypothetical protein